MEITAKDLCSIIKPYPAKQKKNSRSSVMCTMLVVNHPISATLVSEFYGSDKRQRNNKNNFDIKGFVTLKFYKQHYFNICISYLLLQ